MTAKIIDLTDYHVVKSMVEVAEEYRKPEARSFVSVNDRIVSAIELISTACEKLEPGFTARLIDRLRAQKDDGKTGEQS